MTYEELVKEISKTYDNADASAVKEHVAVQFNVYGEGEGAFYIEASEGKVDVQPYEYYDRDAIVTATAEAIVEVTSGKTSFQKAVESSVLNVQGNLEKLYAFDQIVFKKATKKSTTKKTASETKKVAEKKAVEKKPEEKKVEGSAVKSAENSIQAKVEEKKVAEKKATEKKPAEKKVAEKKVAEKKTTKKAAATKQKTIIVNKTENVTVK